MIKKGHRAMALAVMLGVSGCYGPFNLTRKLHAWNGQVGGGDNGKWINEGVFLGLTILPVYAFSALADAIIFNSVEFWTGKNPVTAKNVKTVKLGDEQAVLTYKPESRRLRVDAFEKGRLKSTLIFEPSADGMAALGGKGEVLMTAKTVDGLVVLSSSAGKEIGKYDPATLSRAN